MGYQLVMNVIIALFWMAINDNWTFPGFVIGYLIGIVILVALRRFWGAPLYFRRVGAVLRLLILFIKELFLSSFTVMGHIIRPRYAFRPGIFAYRTELVSDWEITLLSCLICLTPGTLTLEVSPDGQTLYIHAIDIGDTSQLRLQIKNTFETAIMGVTRQ
jgi:multicomponent Na+:H+ antiporter subunit E